MKLDRGDEPEGYAFKSLQGAVVRSVMVPAPGLPEEGPPPVDEAERRPLVRLGAVLQHGIWDPSDGSVRGLRGKSLRRGARRVAARLHAAAGRRRLRARLERRRRT